MNKKHTQTLKRIFQKTPVAEIPWDNIETLFVALGADVSQREGSRIGIALNGIIAVFHVPHPTRIAAHGRIKDVRKFLEKAGVQLP